MTRVTGRVHEMEHHTADRATTRPVVAGTQGVVSAGHPLVSMAGMRMLLSGGNAFDAAVAAGFAAAVVEPTASYTLCGECVALIHDARRGETLAVSGQGTAPALATPAFFRGRGLDRIPTGPGPDAHLSFTVPGAVDAYLTVLETFGTKSLAEALAPAVHYAEHGFPMYEYMRRMLAIAESRSQFDLYPPGGTDVFYPGGRVPEVGELLVQPALAATLAAAGRKPTARAAGTGRPASAPRASASTAATWRARSARSPSGWAGSCGRRISPDTALGSSRRYGRPSPDARSSASPRGRRGPCSCRRSAMLETFDLRAMGHNSRAATSTSWRRRSSSRSPIASATTGTPPPRRRRSRSCSPPPTRGSAPSSSAWTARRPRLPAPGRPAATRRGGADERDGARSVGAGAEVPADGTTHIAAIDRDGNMICLTPSGGVFRKSAFAPELGCTLSTRSEMFVLEEGHPNGLVPGKRPRTTLVSYLICEGGVPTMTVGCPGGDDQAQADLQLVLNVLVFGMNPQQAVEAPRFSTQTLVNSFYPRVYRPGQLNVEPGIPEQRARGAPGASATR